MKPIFILLFLMTTASSFVNCEFSMADEPFMIMLRDNTVLAVDVHGENVNWQQVDADGSIRRNAIPLQEIRSLELSRVPANEDVALVMAKLNQLESTDYHEREAAEDELKKADVVVKYRAIIQQRLNISESFDARYRIQRILEQFSKRAETKPPEFDRVQFMDGRTLQGDAQTASMSFSFRGKLLEFDRNLVRKIFRKQTISLSQGNRKPLSSNTHFDPKTEAAQKLMNLPMRLDFEASPDNQPLVIGQSIETTFASRGVLFEAPTEKPGFVGVAMFGMRQWVADIPCRGNSVAVHSERPSKFRSFEGDLTIHFCVPGRPDTPAGVFRFGTWLAKCNHFRDFIMEAYNADNQIIATTEASSRPAVYLGVTSEEPITRIEIKSNPYLEHAEGHIPSSRIVDTNYAIDDITFSQPQPVNAAIYRPVLPGVTKDTDGNSKLLAAAKAKNIRLETRSGDVIWTNQLEWQTDGAAVRVYGTASPVIIDFNEIISCQLRMPNVFESSKDLREKVKDPRRWHAVLEDRSVVSINVENGFENEWGLKLDQPQIDGLLPAFGPARLVSQSYSQTAIVFPTCTILAEDIEFSNGGISWNRVELVESDLILPEDVDDVDPTQPHPLSNSVQLSDSYVDQVPSIWFRQPKTRIARSGQLVLTDNQQLILGESGTTASFKSISKTGVQILINGTDYSIPWERIAAIRIPN